MRIDKEDMRALDRLYRIYRKFVFACDSDYFFSLHYTFGIRNARFPISETRFHVGLDYILTSIANSNKRRCHLVVELHSSTNHIVINESSLAADCPL